MGSVMLFYFQFLAKTLAAAEGQPSDPMVVHSLVQADNVDSAADQVTNSMRSVYLKIGDVRRAFVVRSLEELGQDRRLLSLSQQAARSRYAFLFEFSNGTEALCGPSLSQFISTHSPYLGKSDAPQAALSTPTSA